MEIKISLEDYADLPFIKKLLSQIKGIKGFEISGEDTESNYYWNKLEKSEAFGKVMEQSDNDYKAGRHQELNDDLLDEIFGKNEN